MENWRQQQISIGALQAEVEELDRLDLDADAKKKVYTEAYALAEEQRNKVLWMLQESGQTKFNVPGLGTVSQALKTSVTVPKTFEDKRAMLDWFKEQGDEVFLTYATVNSQSLNSLIKMKCEEDPGFTIPGVGEKKQVAELRFRRGK